MWSVNPRGQARSSAATSAGSEGLLVRWLGGVPYGEALALQERTVAARRRGEIGDQLLLLEHPAVITLGSGAHEENVRISPAELAVRGIETVRVRRGGDVTFHAPGQLVGYLVVDLSEGRTPDVHHFLREIEGALIEVLAAFGLSGRRIPGWTGVFMDRRPGGGGPLERKIASIGVGLRGWVSYHGFALNVDLDLAGFETIVPCGLEGVEMTSLEREFREFASVPGSCPDAVQVRAQVSEAFCRRFGRCE